MATGQNLADLYVSLHARGNLNQILAPHKARLEAIQKSLADGTYRYQAKLAAQMNAQNATLNRQMRWQDLIAQQGRFGAGLTIAQEKLQGFSQSLAGVSGYAAAAFAAGTGAVTGFTAAASPDAINTLTGSFRLLAGSIGEGFIPYIAEASKRIQDADRWFRGLSAEQKDNIAQWILWGTAAAGVAMILPRIINLGTALITVLRGIGLANPFGVLAVGAAAAAYRLKQMFDEMEDFAKVERLASKGTFDKERYEKSAERQGVFEAKTQSGQEFSQEGKQALARVQVVAARKEADAAMEALQARIAPTAWRAALADMLGVKDPMEARMNNAIVRLNNAQGVLRETYGKTPTLTQAAAKAKDQGQGNYLTSMQMAPASISSIEDVMKNLEVRSLSKGPLEMEEERRRELANAEFRQAMLGHVGGIANAVRDGALGAGR